MMIHVGCMVECMRQWGLEILSTAFSRKVFWRNLTLLAGMIHLLRALSLSLGWCRGIVCYAYQEEKDWKILLHLTALSLLVTYTACDLALACIIFFISSHSNPYELHSTHTGFHSYSNLPNWFWLKVIILIFQSYLPGKQLSKIFLKFFFISLWSKDIPLKRPSLVTLLKINSQPHIVP